MQAGVGQKYKLGIFSDTTSTQNLTVSLSRTPVFAEFIIRDVAQIAE